MADKDMRWKRIVIVVHKDRWGMLVEFELMRMTVDGQVVPFRS